MGGGWWVGVGWSGVMVVVVGRWRGGGWCD